MFEFKYSLDNQASKEYHSYLAMHDKSILKLNVTLIVAMSLFMFIAFILIFGMTIKSVLFFAISVAIIFVFFPKIFWSIQFKRIDRIIDNSPLNYPMLNVQVDSKIKINENNNEFFISRNNVVNVAFTKHYGIVFYLDYNKNQLSWIFPIDALNQTQLSRLMDVLGYE